MKNKILDFVQKFLAASQDKGSKDRAVERLKLILISDRSNLSPELIEKLKEDLVRVVSSYMDVDMSSMEVYLEKGDDQVALTASLPVKSVKRKTGVREKG